MEYKFLKTKFIAFSGLLYNDCEDGSSQNVGIERVAHLVLVYEIGMILKKSSQKNLELAWPGWLLQSDVLVY